MLSSDPLALSEPQAFGWAWHGLLQQRSLNNTSAFPATQTLADGTVLAVEGVRLERNTLLFDRGMVPPETAESISERGGEWRGDAILRYGGANAVYYGGGINLRGLPLWLPDADPPEMPFFGYPALETNADTGVTRLLWRYLQGGNLVLVPVPLTLAQLGQVEQVDCLGFVQNGPLSLGPIDATSIFSLTVLDVWRNKILVGVTGTARTATKNKPGGANPGNLGAIPGAWSNQYIALAEITCTAKDVVSWSLIQDRNACLGNPVRDGFDERVGSTWPYTSWDYRNEVTIEGALLNAWYAQDGSVRTCRYNRTEVSTLVYVNSTGGGVDESYDANFSVTLQLLTAAGSVADTLTVYKRVQQSNDTSGYHFISTIGRNDDPPSVERYDRETPSRPPPLRLPIATIDFGVEQMLINLLGEVISDTPGGPNLIEPQGYRQIWVARLSNKAAALCFSFEDSPYDNGEQSLLELDAGPAVTPAGVHPGRSIATVTYPDPGLGGRRFGFFNQAAYTFVHGSFNPVTGELARHDVTYHNSWV